MNTFIIALKNIFMFCWNFIFERSFTSFDLFSIFTAIMLQYTYTNWEFWLIVNMSFIISHYANKINDSFIKIRLGIKGS